MLRMGEHLSVAAQITNEPRTGTPEGKMYCSLWRSHDALQMSSCSRCDEWLHRVCEGCQTLCFTEELIKLSELLENSLRFTCILGCCVNCHFIAWHCQITEQFRSSCCCSSETAWWHCSFCSYHVLNVSLASYKSSCKLETLQIALGHLQNLYI